METHELVVPRSIPMILPMLTLPKLEFGSSDYFGQLR
jgi:hypothetical protein